MQNTADSFTEIGGVFLTSKIHKKFK